MRIDGFSGFVGIAVFVVALVVAYQLGKRQMVG